jgi:hypothetical protein
MIFTINGTPSDLTRYDNLLDVDSHLNQKEKLAVKQQDDTLD